MCFPRSFPPDSFFMHIHSYNTLYHKHKLPCLPNQRAGSAGATTFLSNLGPRSARKIHRQVFWLSAEELLASSPPGCCSTEATVLLSLRRIGLLTTTNDALPRKLQERCGNTHPPFAVNTQTLHH